MEKILANNIKEISENITKLLKEDDFFIEIKPSELKEAVLNYPLQGGKRLRVVLTLWCCGLLNGNIEQAMYAAAAAEVYHNWTLVHDDIIDADDLRRGKPSSHKKLAILSKDKYKLTTLQSEKYGVDFAILAGDLQQSWAISLLMKSTHLGVSEKVVHSICNDMVKDLSVKLISGEALDVSFSYRIIDSISYKDVEDMLILKTGALLNFCAISGAKIALKTTNNQHKDIQKLVNFTTSMGLAFQLRDDYLGIYGEIEKLGKTIGSDISSKKPTLLLLETLRRTNHIDKKTILSLLGKNNLTKKDIETVRRIMEASGAKEIIAKKILELKTKAEEALLSFPKNKYQSLLLKLNDYLSSREK